MLSNFQIDNINILLLTGDLGKKQRKVIKESIQNFIQNKKSFCLFATGSLIGEGFDIPELNTLLLTMPISFKGRLIQYAGRLHRNLENDIKKVLIYDYVDTTSGLTISMFKKRLTAYKKMNYEFDFNIGEKLKKLVLNI